MEDGMADAAWGEGWNAKAEARMGAAKTAARAAGHDPDEVVATDARDRDGNALEQPVWWSFPARADAAGA